MWIRLRLDIGWWDLCNCFGLALLPGGRRAARERIESTDSLACLSVRSGFDLLLQALNFPAETEILYTAVNLGDMIRIAEAHNLVPIPVPVQGSDYHIDVEELKKRVTPNTRMLVIAHLYGARLDIQEILEFAKAQGIFVVEDCAQAWFSPSWTGNPNADATLFSFGTIKTATASGGAICHIRSPEVLNRMRELQNEYPVQSSLGYPRKLLKLALLKAFSSRLGFRLFTWLGRLLGKSVDDLLASLTRGFSKTDFLKQIRQQPATTLLRLLHYRLTTYNELQIERRIQNAHELIATLKLEKTQPELLSTPHSFWLFPYLCDRPEELIAWLGQNGFDCTRRGRMELVPAPSNRQELHCAEAEELWNKTVFLPCYPELSPADMRRMGEAILAFRAK
ncbi:MAG: aminotransferase class V-fold PLP-dependent enzyme [Planctomycetaceae bacterium]